MHLNADQVLVWTRRFVAERIAPAVNEQVAALDVGHWVASTNGADTPVPRRVGLAADYRPISVGAAWGAPWTTTWFRITGEVPRDQQHRDLEIDLDLGFDVTRPGFQAEGLAIDPSGRTLKGIHPRSRWIRVTDPVIEVFVEAAANPNIGMRDQPYSMTHLGDPQTAGTAPIYTFAGANLVHRNREVAALATELTSLGELAEQLPIDSPRRWEIVVALDQALARLDPVSVAATAPESRRILRPVLQQRASPSALSLTAVGHAHLDTAWLWPLRETRRKAVRTMANAVALADVDDDALFTVSAAQHLAWVKEDDPELYGRIVDHVASGRIVPVGGTWVEPDANLPGGESFIRQLTMGLRFFEAEFGHRCRELWLPDSFGYSASLPQLARLAGMRWFLTQKISWNNENVFPHHTLWWEGIDGTRLFTHFPSADTYCSELTGAELAHAERNYKDKGRSNLSLLPYGYGDGGGGPTRDMLDTLRTVADLEGSPRLVRRTPAEFFGEAEAQYPDAPVWVGELYLEKHRGAATSQAAIKAGNRRNEALLHEAELWATTAHIRTGANYPQEALAHCWREVLVNQFHDVLPGTSIAWVHREAVDKHAAVTEHLEVLIEEALQALGSVPGRGLVADASPMGHGAMSIAPTEGVADSVHGHGRTLDNGRLRVVVDEAGLVISLFDLEADRELVPAGQRLGLLQLHHDFPSAWDAWDIDMATLSHGVDVDAVEDLSVEVRDRQGVIRVVRKFRSSSVTQEFVLEPGSMALLARVSVDWHEQDALLKMSWPVDLHTQDVAFEVPFGHLRRATHRNTSWDASRFEVSAHRWLHVAEGDYGVGLANSRTYGWDTRRHTRPAGPSWTELRATLLKGGRFPDPYADEGLHAFEFMIMPGADLLAARSSGYRLTTPPRLRAGTQVKALAQATGPAIIETVKLCDDGSGDVILRVFEPQGQATRATVLLDFDVVEVRETDLLEHDSPDHEIPRALSGVAGRTISLSLHPFQVVTLRVLRHVSPTETETGTRFSQ